MPGVEKKWLGDARGLWLGGKSAGAKVEVATGSTTRGVGGSCTKKGWRLGTSNPKLGWNWGFKAPSSLWGEISSPG